VSARHKRRGDKVARRERVRRIADVLKQYDQSPFQYEAACTHGLRAALVLRGWPWQAAQDEARQLVQAALDMIGARRPSYEMGQPGYVHRHLSGFERTQCAWCNRPLPPNHSLWCSSTCRQSAHGSKYRRKLDGDAWAIAAARRASWSTPWDEPA
jgi:hypothetical protein